MNLPQVTVVVINWKLKEKTLQCLRSLEQLDYHCRILVVDNGSGDGSTQYISQHFPSG